MNILKKIHLSTHVFFATVDKIALVGMICVVSLEVISRQLFNKGFGWSQEIALFLLLWFAFLSMVQGVHEKLHIGITILYDRVPQKVKFIFDKIAYFSIGVVGGLLFFYGIKLCESTMSSTLPATQIPSGIQYLVIPLSGFMIMLDSLVFIFQKQEVL